jgi:hypothetical protein
MSLGRLISREGDVRSTRAVRSMAVMLGATLQVGVVATALAESDVLAWEPSATVTLTFDATKDPLAAHGSAILRNPSPFNLAIELRLVGGDTVDAVTLDKPPTEIGPGSAMEVDLSIAGTEALIGLKGSIVAEAVAPSSDVAVGPAVVAFEIVGTTVKATKMLAEPASVTMTVDRCVPSFVSGLLESLGLPPLRDCLVYWPPSTWPEPDRPTARVAVHGVDALNSAPQRWRLSGDTGVVELALMQAPAPITAAPTASPDHVLLIQVADPGEPGKYSGDIPVAVDTKDTPTIPTTVHVQDHLLWPALAILVGAVAAYLVVPKRDQARSRDVLDARLVEIFEETGDRSCRFPLKAFPVPAARQAGDVDRPLWPAIPTDPLTPAEQLHIDIFAATTQERLGDLAKKVDDLAEVVAQWKLACKRHAELTVLFAALTQPRGTMPDDAPIAAATRTLLARTDPFLEKSAATEVAAALKDQADALKLWIRASSVLTHARAIWNALDSRDLPLDARAILDRNNPAALTEGYLSPATDLETIRRLQPERRAREMFVVLRSLEESLRVDRIEGDESMIGAAAAVVGAAEAEVEAAQAAAPADLAPPVPSREIRDRIARQDWLQLLAVTGAAAVIYLGTLYPGHDFGSPWHYTTAVLAGMTGAVAIKWDLLPWARLFRPATPKQ